MSSARQKAAHVITAMSRGAILRLTFSKRGSDFVLSDGTIVPAVIAMQVVNDLRVVPHDGGLFPGLAQSWKYEEPRSS